MNLFNFKKQERPTDNINIKIGYDTLRRQYWIRLIDMNTNYEIGIYMDSKDFRDAGQTMLDMVRFYSEMN